MYRASSVFHSRMDDFVFVRGLAPLFAIAALLSAGHLEAQRVVKVEQEPRHRVVVDHPEFKLLDVQILPGDTTLDHTHDSPILYTYISLGNGSAGGRVTANTRYAVQPFTHRVSNSGPDLFRIIALAHFGEGRVGHDDRPDGMNVEPQLENEWFRSYRLELAPGQETGPITHKNPTFIILVSDGRTRVTKENGFGAELTKQGDWTMRESDSPFSIRNDAREPVSIVVNEAR